MKLDLGVLERRLGNRYRLLVTARGEEVHPDLTGQGFKLVNGRRTIDVGRYHQHLFLFTLLEIACQLGHGGGFTRPLQTGHQYHGRRPFEHQSFVRLAHDRLKLLLDDLDELVARRQAPGNFLSHGALAHTLNESLDHWQGDIGLKQRTAHFAQRILDIVFGQARLSLDGLERVREPITEILKHSPLRLSVRQLGTSRSDNAVCRVWKLLYALCQPVSMYGTASDDCGPVRRGADWL